MKIWLLVFVRESKKFPIVIAWGTKHIHLGDLEFLKNGSLVLKSTLHNDKNVSPIIEFGTSNYKDGQFNNRSADQAALIGKGFHITLHPADNTHLAAMHFREHSPGPILFRREITWFPVSIAFNLASLFTMPLDRCSISQKKVTVETAIDPNYIDSLEWVVDIFPKDIKVAAPYSNSVEIWGHCPDYRVRVSIMFAKQRTPALIYWPEDSELTL